MSFYFDPYGEYEDLHEETIDPRLLPRTSGDVEDAVEAERARMAALVLPVAEEMLDAASQPEYNSVIVGGWADRIKKAIAGEGRDESDFTDQEIAALSLPEERHPLSPEMLAMWGAYYQRHREGDRRGGA